MLGAHKKKSPHSCGLMDDLGLAWIGIWWVVQQSNPSFLANRGTAANVRNQHQAAGRGLPQLVRNGRIADG